MTELAKRLRAARGYAGLSQPALAKKLEVSQGTVKRSESGERSPKRGELMAIADACEVPMWFLEGGWEGWRATEPGAGEGDRGEAPDPWKVLEDLDREGGEEDRPQPGEGKAADA